MSVRTNTASMVAQRNVSQNEALMNAAVGKISSGKRIDKISVDAAGFAIATNITANINTLSQARRNAAQGGSVAQVASGGMTQVGLILQRMKTLSAQVTSGALSDTERSYADAEYQKLLSQVGNIATQTRFNGTSLLGGGSSTVTNSGAVTAAFVGTPSAYTTGVGNMFNSSITSGLSQGYIEGTVVKANTVGLPGSASAQLFKSQLKIGNQTFEAIHNSPAFDGNTANLTTMQGASLIFVSTSNQSNVIAVPWNVSSDSVLNTTNAISASQIQTNLQTLFGSTNGQNAQVRMSSTGSSASITNFSAPTGGVSGVWAISHNAGKFSATDGTTVYNVTTTSAGAQALTFANGITVNTSAAYTTSDSISQFRLDITAGATSSLNFQVGEKASDTISLTLDSVTASALGINSTSITNTTNAATASLKIDAALTTLNTALASVGATQSQFEFSAATTAVTVENLTATRGVIEDADIPFEMSEFAKFQVLTQMSTAMLAQANQIPQFVLRLMG